ncbi:MAG: type I restriction-modification enzyme R subunit C-terminal domain-containing protein, partial [Hominimerdicola sp.]
MSDADEVSDISYQEDDIKSIKLEFSGDSSSLDEIKNMALSLGAAITMDNENGILSVDTYDNHKDELLNKAYELNVSTSVEQEKPVTVDFLSGAADSVSDLLKNQDIKELTPKEQSFLNFDVESVMTKSPLAWDEIEDIGYILFEKGYIYKHNAHEKAIYGNGLREPELYDIAKRMQGGEDVRKELSIALLGRQGKFTTKVGNEFTVIYNDNDITAKFGNAEKSVSYEAIGDAFLSLIKSEYNDIVHDRTVDDLKYVIPDLTDENAEQLINAFDNAKMADWQGDSVKETRIKKAIYNILNDEKQTEKAFASISDMKYNYKVELFEQNQEQINENHIVDKFRAKTNELFHNINGYNPEDVEYIVKDYVSDILNENDINAEMGRVIVSGSRCRGMENENSDIDVVIEMSSDLKEYELFNILNEESLDIDGIPVDINPIKADETGTLETYLPTVESYLAEHETEIPITESEPLTASNTEKERSEPVKPEPVAEVTPETEKPDIPDVKNLSQLKKAIKPGMMFEITDHLRPECIGERRIVTGVSTVDFTSRKLDENGKPMGKDLHMEFDRAKNWTFDGGELTSRLDNGDMLMSFHFIDSLEREQTVQSEKEPELAPEKTADDIKSIKHELREGDVVTFSDRPDVWRVSEISDLQISFENVDENSPNRSFSHIDFGANRDNLQETLKYVLVSDAKMKEHEARNPITGFEPDPLSKHDMIHNAFEKLKENHEFSENTTQFLNRVEKQMEINGYDKLEPRLFENPLFTQTYGNLNRINEKLFDKKIQDVITEINGYINAETNISDISVKEKINPERTTLNKPESENSQLSFFDMPAENTENNIIQTTEQEKQVIHSATSFQIKDENLGEGGAKAKFNANINAIQTLQKIEAENRTATPDEQEILSKYVGWGGLANAFDESKSDWANEYAQLKDLLTEKEYSSARASTLDSFYTAPAVIDGIYKALEQFGFKGGNVLEPAMGIGNFFGRMPADMQKNSKLYGVEIDSISGRIAQKLYPNADIAVQGFEKNKFQNGCFDVAVGNVPFGELAFKDNKHGTTKLHDYFFAETL